MSTDSVGWMQTRTYPHFIQFPHALGINFKLGNTKDRRIKIIILRKADQCLSSQRLGFIFFVSDEDIAPLGPLGRSSFPAPSFNGNGWEVFFNGFETFAIGTMLISDGDLNQKDALSGKHDCVDGLKCWGSRKKTEREAILRHSRQGRQATTDHLVLLGPACRDLEIGMSVGGTSKRA